MLGVVLDVSTSLSRTLGLQADAASHFFTTVMRPNNYGFLISYASRIQTLQVAVDDSAKLAEEAQTIRRGGRSDGVNSGVNMPNMHDFRCPVEFRRRRRIRPACVSRGCTTRSDSLWIGFSGRRSEAKLW